MDLLELIQILKEKSQTNNKGMAGTEVVVDKELLKLACKYLEEYKLNQRNICLQNILSEKDSIRLIDANSLLKKMDTRYKECSGKVPDNLAEGFMQMRQLIEEQPTFSKSQVSMLDIDSDFSENVKQFLKDNKVVYIRKK